MIRVDDAEGPTAQGAAHALGALADQLDGVRHRDVERGLGERQRVELQVGAQRRNEIAEHRAADHAGEDLERALPRLRLSAPAAVEHREPRLVARRQRDAVQQLAPLHAERLPRLLELDERTVPHRRRVVARQREEIRDGVARPVLRVGRPLGEHYEPLEVQDVPRHVVRLRRPRRRGRAGLSRGPLARARRRLRQPGGRCEVNRPFPQRRGDELDRLLIAEPHPQPQLGNIAPRDRHGAVRLAHPVTGRIPRLVEHGHGHALRGLARVLVHDPEHPDVLLGVGHKGATNMQLPV